MMAYRPIPGARRGLMLVEVLLALAISGMVAAVVAAMLFALANGARDRQDMRHRNARADVLTARVDTALRSCGMLLGRDANCLVLWVADTRKNGKPDLSELRRIEWDAASKQVRCYQAPAGLADSDNTTFQLSDDFLAATAAVAGSATFPAEVWGTSVTGWSSGTVPAGATQDARMVAYSVTLTTAAGTVRVPSSAPLRGTSIVER
jgi:type II secretory pathway pseudopilin PulG